MLRGWREEGLVIGQRVTDLNVYLIQKWVVTILPSRNDGSWLLLSER